MNNSDNNSSTVHRGRKVTRPTSDCEEDKLLFCARFMARVHRFGFGADGQLSAVFGLTFNGGLYPTKRFLRLASDGSKLASH